MSSKLEGQFLKPPPIYKRKKLDEQNTTTTTTTTITTATSSDEKAKQFQIIDFQNWLPYSEQEQYDPSHPNDYEDIIIERRKKIKQQQKQIKLHQQLQLLQRQRQGSTQSGVSNNSAIDLEISAQQTFLNRARKSMNKQDSKSSSSQNRAKKMMEKMGWKGQGLGKDEQGIVAPLIARKHDRNSGKIVQSQFSYQNLNQKPLGQSQGASTLPKRTVNFNIQPTKVVLLMNMVQPQQADSNFATQVGEECLKFGDIKSVQVVIIQNVPKEIAVRVFVYFEEQASAIRALVDLGVRYFGGNPVFACFFDEDDFVQRNYQVPQRDLNSVLDEVGKIMKDIK